MANNPYVNKVIYGNSTVMDISDTTATESDVASGKTFYKASGARSTGTGSTNYYSPDDTVETTAADILADDDLMPFYDTSATTKKNSTWANIKAKIKALVDPVRITLNKSAYDALSSTEKNDPDKVYYVPDYEDTSKTWVTLDDTTTAADKVWSSSKISTELGTTTRIDDTTTVNNKTWSSTKVATELGTKFDTGDTTEATLANEDTFPFYDYSASAKRKTTWSNLVAKIKATLATVARTGSYNDLTNKPTIPAAQVNSDWNASSGVAQILNKPTIPAAQVNADWNSSSGVSEILNKPTIPSVEDSLTSSSTSNALSANQGKILNTSKADIATNARNYIVQTVASQTIDGITYTVQDDGGIKANGTADSGGSILYLDSEAYSIPIEQGLLIGCPEGGAASNGYRLCFYCAGATWYDTGSGTEFDVSLLSTPHTVRTYINIAGGVTVNNIVFYPAIISYDDLPNKTLTSRMPQEIVRTGVTSAANIAIRIPASGTEDAIKTSSTIIPICDAKSDGTPVKYKSCVASDGYVNLTLAEAVSNIEVGVIVINQ